MNRGNGVVSRKGTESTKNALLPEVLRNLSLLILVLFYQVDKTIEQVS